MCYQLVSEMHVGKINRCIPGRRVVDGDGFVRVVHVSLAERFAVRKLFHEVEVEILVACSRALAWLDHSPEKVLSPSQDTALLSRFYHWLAIADLELCEFVVCPTFDRGLNERKAQGRGEE